MQKIRSKSFSPSKKRFLKGISQEGRDDEATLTESEQMVEGIADLMRQTEQDAQDVKRSDNADSKDAAAKSDDDMGFSLPGLDDDDYGDMKAPDAKDGKGEYVDNEMDQPVGEALFNFDDVEGDNDDEQASAPAESEKDNSAAEAPAEENKADTPKSEGETEAAPSSGKKGGLSVLQKKHSEQDQESDYLAYEQRIKMSEEKARRTMNLLGTMGPIFKRVIGNADSDNAARLVTDLLTRAESLKTHLYPIFNAENEAEVPAWLKAQLTRFSTTMVAENPTLSVDDLVAMCESLSDFMPDIKSEYSNNPNDRSQFKLTLINALARIEGEIADFQNNLTHAGDLELAEKIKKHRETILSDITRFINDKVADAFVKLREEGAGTKTNTMLVQSLTNQATEFYIQSLSHEISNYWERKKVQSRRGRGQDIIEKYIKRHPTGLPKENIEKSASLSFDSMVAATEKEFEKQFSRLVLYTYDKIEKHSNQKIS